MSWDYESLKETTASLCPPYMVVDMDILDKNINNIKSIAQKNGKTIRLASKSIRSVGLLDYIMKAGSPFFKGIMCFCAQEAQFLYDKGFDNLLIAYPTVNPTDLEILKELTQKQADISIVMDHPEHIEAVKKYWNKSSETLGICIEIDMSYRPLLGNIHLGVQRSSIRNFYDFRKFVNLVRKNQFIKIKGVMGYEAQIAGIGENNPFFPLLNPIKKRLKTESIKDVFNRRARIGKYLKAHNIKLDFFNGGGTGSLSSTSQEEVITEIAAGSGFLQSHLFDYYENNVNDPAFSFALQITRFPEKGIITCQSGGFIASGETGEDKAPLPFLPHGLETIKTEGYGEVQTPLKNKNGYNFNLGDPVFFRPSKSGEIAERFNNYLLIRNGKISKKILTYRGEGKCFY